MPAKKIIIIGASSGIGKEMAKVWAGRGNQVAITGRRQKLLEEMKKEYPNKIITSRFDVMGNENQKQFYSLVQQLNGLDLLVFNAGYGNPSSQLDWETENTTTRTNVNGFLEIINCAFTYFSHQGYGQIAVTSSVGAIRGNSYTPAYSASKAFMSNYAEGLNIKAQKLKKDILITDLRPGFINTKTTKGNGRFWVANPKKAALQIINAIEKRKRVAYITKRWWLIAQILKFLPFSIYRRLA